MLHIVSKELFLADHNPSNWGITVIEPVDEEDVAHVTAFNRVTLNTFEDTLEAFNNHLAVPLGAVAATATHNADHVYDINTGEFMDYVLMAWQSTQP